MAHFLVKLLINISHIDYRLSALALIITKYTQNHSRPFSHQPTKQEFNRKIVSRNSSSSYLIPYTYPVFGSYTRAYNVYNDNYHYYYYIRCACYAAL